MSAYHLYGKPGNSGENSNGTVHPFSGKNSNIFRRYYLFPFLPKRAKFSVPFVWITSARLQCRKKAKNLPVFCKWYNSIPFLFSVPEKKKVNLVEYNSWTQQRKPTKRNFSIVVTIAHLDLKCADVSGINLN